MVKLLFGGYFYCLWLCNDLWFLGLIFIFRGEKDVLSWGGYIIDLECYSGLLYFMRISKD